MFTIGVNAYLTCREYSSRGELVQQQAELMGMSEIAELAGVSRSAVANWRARFPNFPAPVADLQAGPVFRRDQVRRWLRKKRMQLAMIMCSINLKGGVTKTTTTVALAEFLSAVFGKKVLVIDLDPQTNASVMLIGEKKWSELNARGHTLAQLFKDALAEDPAERYFDLSKTLQKNVSPVRDVRTVDLLPSSLDLIDVQDRLGSMSSGKFHSNVPTDILRRAVKPIIDEYDFVLIDCPPNLGIITLNGLRIATGYIIPTIPDVLSTYGIPQIITRVEDFAENVGADVEPLGIVVSKYRAQSGVHNNTLNSLRKDKRMRVFKTVIAESDKIAGSAEFVESAELRPNTLRQKYGYSGQYDAFYALTREIIEASEPEVATA
jgi:chromosome partitioning protein